MGRTMRIETPDTLLAASALLKAGDLDSRELIAIAYDRIRERDSRLGCFRWLMTRAEALARAAEAPEAGLLDLARVQNQGKRGGRRQGREAVSPVSEGKAPGPSDVWSWNEPGLTVVNEPPSLGVGFAHHAFSL